MHAEEVSVNTPNKGLEIYWNENAFYISSSILVKYGYLFEVDFIVNWNFLKTGYMTIQTNNHI